MDSSGSKSDDYRSVIDDLTVENKRLKQSLKKYEELHCSHLQEDKLFEVRIYGLPLQKKRELEGTLRDFASGLEEHSRGPGDHPGPQPPTAAPLRQASSLSTSYSRPTDSAYASMFACGNIHVAKPHDEPQQSPLNKPAGPDINFSPRARSEAPFAGDPLKAAERAKKKLVVQRLEQLFTGTGPSLEPSSQSQQQQEVFHSAARADGNRYEARGDPVGVEGVREARIGKVDVGSMADGASDVRGSTKLRLTSHNECFAATSRNEENHADSDSSPDQRPTHPLDLDLNRAQVPAENIKYMRHLGFPSSRAGESVSDKDGDGWVYLNLLTSMAQLHTINVTPDFVREALIEVSNQFELSQDGRKIRWKGGVEATQMISEVGSSGTQSDAKSPYHQAGPITKRRKLRDNHGREHVKTDCRSQDRVEDTRPTIVELAPRPTKMRPICLGQAKVDAHFDYKPLFLHTTCLHAEDKSCTSPASAELTGNGSSAVSSSSALPSSGTLSNRLGSEHGVGPMIFYHSASFCTDLSADRGYMSDNRVVVDPHSRDPLGCVPYKAQDPFGHPAAAKRTFGEYMTFSDRTGLKAIDDGVNPSGFQVQTMCSTGSDTTHDTRGNFQLEASGIGGVQPFDHFAIDVEVRYAPLAQSQAEHKVEGKLRLPAFSALPCEGFDRSSTRLTVTGEIISTTTTNLSPSPLPPPSYYVPPSPSESDDDEGSTTASDDSNSNPSPSLGMNNELITALPNRENFTISLAP